MKKLLSVLLCVAMLVTMMPGMAWADTNEVEPVSDTAEEMYWTFSENLEYESFDVLKREAETWDVTEVTNVSEGSIWKDGDEMWFAPRHNNVNAFYFAAIVNNKVHIFDYEDITVSAMAQKIDNVNGATFIEFNNLGEVVISATEQVDGVNHNYALTFNVKPKDIYYAYTNTVEKNIGEVTQQEIADGSNWGNRLGGQEAGSVEVYLTIFTGNDEAPVKIITASDLSSQTNNNTEIVTIGSVGSNKVNIYFAKPGGTYLYYAYGDTIYGLYVDVQPDDDNGLSEPIFWGDPENENINAPQNIVGTPKFVFAGLTDIYNNTNWFSQLEAEADGNCNFYLAWHIDGEVVTVVPEENNFLVSSNTNILEIEAGLNGQYILTFKAPGQCTISTSDGNFTIPVTVTGGDNVNLKIHGGEWFAGPGDGIGNGIFLSTMTVYDGDDVVTDYTVRLADGTAGTIDKTADGKIKFIPLKAGQTIMVITYGGNDYEFTFDVEEHDVGGNNDDDTSVPSSGDWNYAVIKNNDYVFLKNSGPDAHVEAGMFFYNEHKTNTFYIMFRKPEGTINHNMLNYWNRDTGDFFKDSELIVTPDGYYTDANNCEHIVWKVVVNNIETFDRWRMRCQINGNRNDVFFLGKNYVRAGAGSGFDNMIPMKELPIQSEWEDSSIFISTLGENGNNTILSGKHYLNMSKSVADDRNSFYILHMCDFDALEWDVNQYIAYVYGGTELSSGAAGRFAKKLADEVLNVAPIEGKVIKVGNAAYKVAKVNLSAFQGHENLLLSFYDGSDASENRANTYFQLSMGMDIRIKGTDKDTDALEGLKHIKDGHNALMEALGFAPVTDGFEFVKNSDGSYSAFFDKALATFSEEGQGYQCGLDIQLQPEYVINKITSKDGLKPYDFSIENRYYYDVTDNEGIKRNNRELRDETGWLAGIGNQGKENYMVQHVLASYGDLEKFRTAGFETVTAFNAFLDGTAKDENNPWGEKFRNDLAPYTAELTGTYTDYTFDFAKELRTSQNEIVIEISKAEFGENVGTSGGNANVEIVVGDKVFTEEDLKEGEVLLHKLYSNGNTDWYIAKAYEITEKDGDGVFNGFVNITIPRSEFKGNNENFEVYYFTKDGVPVKLETAYTGNGLVFMTGHFSTYAIVSTGVADDNIPLEIVDEKEDGFVIEWLEVNTSETVGDNYFYVTDATGLEYEVRINDHSQKDSENWPLVDDPQNYVTIGEPEDGYRKVIIGAGGKYHGHEDLRINFTAGEESAHLIVEMGVEVKYNTDAISALYDMVWLKEELLADSTFSYKTPVATTSTGTALYSGLGTTSHGNGIIGKHVQLVAKLKPGYTIDNIKITADGTTTDANYSATVNHYYALYDAEGKRADATKDEYFNLFNGVVNSDTSSVIWVDADITDRNNPLEDLKAQMQGEGIPAGLTVELLESVIQYDIVVDDVTKVNSLEIITNESAINAGSEVSLVQGNSFSATPTTSTADQATQLEKYYGKDLEVKKIYDITAELNDGDIVDVVIPVDNAANHQVVWFTDGDNTPVPMITNTTADGKGLIMTTSHFSKYAVIGTATEDEGGADGDDDNQDDGGNDNTSGTPDIYIPVTPPAPSAPKDEVTNQTGTTTTAPSTNADMSESTTMKGNETTTKVDQTIAGKIVENAVANKSEEVVIDATYHTESSNQSTKSATVEVPTETIQQIAEKTEAAVTIKTDVAEIKLDTEALAAVAEQAEGKSVSVVAEKVKADAKEIRVELKVVCSEGKTISDFKGGNISVTVEAPKGKKDVVCVYIDEQGHWHTVPGQLNADGTYTFTTGHFSTYAIVDAEHAADTIAAQKEAVKNVQLKIRSANAKTSKGKKAIKLTISEVTKTGIDFDGHVIYRSTKKTSGFKKIYTTKTGTYFNTSAKKGVKYYYKAKGFVTIDGEKVYTGWSKKAIRTAK